MIYQAQEKGCGYAAIKNLLAYNGFAHAESLAEPPIEEKAPTLSELIAFASQFGLTLSGYKFLEPSALSTCDCFPLLLMLEENGKEHLVMAKKKKKDRYLILDPASGESWQKEKELLAKFGGVYLRQLSYESKEEKGEAMPSLKRPLIAYVLPLFPFLEAALAFFAVMFFSSVSNFTLLLLFVAAYCLLILSRSVFLLASMEQFDAQWSQGLATREKEERKEALKHYLSYKKASIVPWASLPENIACFAFIFFLVAVNEPLFACLTLIPFSIFFLDKLLLRKKQKKEIASIASKEEAFLQSEETIGKRMTMLSDLFSSLTVYTRKELSKKAILVLLCLASSCLGLLSGEFASNRFLLFVFSSLYLLSLGERIFADLENIETEKRERPYFYQHFVCRGRFLEEEENDKI